MGFLRPYGHTRRNASAVTPRPNVDRPRRRGPRQRTTCRQHTSRKCRVRCASSHSSQARGDTGLRCGTADFERGRRVVWPGGDARQLPSRLLRVGGAPGGLARLGLDLPGYPGGGQFHPAVRDGRDEIPGGRSGALPGRVARQPQAAGSGPGAGPGQAGSRASSRLAQWGGMAVVGALLLAFGNGGVSYAEKTLPSGLAALLVASVPLWMG